MADLRMFGLLNDPDQSPSRKERSDFTTEYRKAFRRVENVGPTAEEERKRYNPYMENLKFRIHRQQQEKMHHDANFEWVSGSPSDAGEESTDLVDDHETWELVERDDVQNITRDISGLEIVGKGIYRTPQHREGAKDTGTFVKSSFATTGGRSNLSHTPSVNFDEEHTEVHEVPVKPHEGPLKPVEGLVETPEGPLMVDKLKQPIPFMNYGSGNCHSLNDRLRFKTHNASAGLHFLYPHTLERPARVKRYDESRRAAEKEKADKLKALGLEKKPANREFNPWQTTYSTAFQAPRDIEEQRAKELAKGGRRYRRRTRRTGLSKPWEANTAVATSKPSAGGKQKSVGGLRD
eukprot:Clim_evm65s207 gene=Clim_evmTU65s207